MTPEEIICNWMFQSNVGWWRISHSGEWRPVELTLDRIWQVEERLTEEQRWDYADILSQTVLLCHRPSSIIGPESTFVIIHASAQQKIAALAAAVGKDK